MDNDCYDMAAAVASFALALGMAVPGMLSTYVRRAAVGFIQIRMPRMTMPTVPTMSAVGTVVAAVDRHVGNGTMAKSITDRLFPPVNLTRDHEQVYEKRKENVITGISDWFEKNFKGAGDAAYLAMHAVWGFFAFALNAAAQWFWKKIFGERVAVVETAAPPPPTKNARKKSPAPARKSTRARK